MTGNSGGRLLGRAGRLGRPGGGGRRGCGNDSAFTRRSGFERGDQIAILTFRLATARFEIVQDVPDAVDRRQNQADVRGLGPPLIAHLTDQGFRRMREPFQPAQLQKAAGAFDGMNQAEDIGDGGTIRGITLKMNDLRPDLLKMISGLGKEIVQQLFHGVSVAARHLLARGKSHHALEGLRDP